VFWVHAANTKYLYIDLFDEFGITWHTNPHKIGDHTNTVPITYYKASLIKGCNHPSFLRPQDLALEGPGLRIEW
jgi:hypothetical protein